jgi:kynurenine 3-monooxygenase
MRQEEVAAGRSINLALSDRGIAALSEVGIEEKMLCEAIPMRGRMIHDRFGNTKLLPYSGRSGEYINSVSRGGLNIALIDEAEAAGVKFYFNNACTDFDVETGEAIFADGQRINSDTVIATDGAGSAVRQALEKRLASFHSSSDFLDHGYKELHIPPHDGDGEFGKFAMEPNSLHIWPRHQFMMIALPNFDGSYTCTLFIAQRSGPPEMDSTPAFDRLNTEASVEDLFRREFPDALELMPTLAEDFFHNPIGMLGTVKCSPWHLDGKALLLGDSAHAMVPFYGQGMNCAFEDVRVLAGLIDKQMSEPSASAGGHNVIDWQNIFEEYSTLRKQDAEAIQNMAVENFYEMRDAVADPVFQRKRELETKLEQTFPDYFSKYSMVTFREDLPYSEAKRLGNAQDALLMNICRPIKTVGELDIESVILELRKLK